MIINNETGEIIEESEESQSYQLAKRELNELAIFDEWLEVKENLETAKEYYKFIEEFYERAQNSGDTPAERLGFTAKAAKTSTHYSLKLVRKLTGFELDYAITTYKILTENEFDLFGRK